MMTWDEENGHLGWRDWEEEHRQHMAGFNAAKAGRALGVLLRQFGFVSDFEEAMQNIVSSKTPYKNALRIFGKKAAMVAVIKAHELIRKN